MQVVQPQSLIYMHDGWCRANPPVRQEKSLIALPRAAAHCVVKVTRPMLLRCAQRLLHRFAQEHRPLRLVGGVHGFLIQHRFGLGGVPVRGCCCGARFSSRITITESRDPLNDLACGGSPPPACSVNVGRGRHTYILLILTSYQVKADILAVMNKDPNRGPTLVRLAWHASGTYDRISKNGGSIGGTIRFQDELSHGANAGLYTAVEWLEPLKKKYPAISYGDLYTLGGVVAIEKMGGPKIKWRAGRKDQGVEAVTPDGRLPAADLGNPMKTAQGLRDVFYRMGFDDREIVALSGAHALGRCHANYSGYEGPWTPTPTLFAGSTYFKLLKAVKWTPKEWKGPFQYEDPSGSLMMLPSDIVLLQDKKFASYVDKYAADDALFFKDFSAAFSKLLELGTSNLEEVTLA
ncbi:unnamed protein product [Discosporangium mesarthrocarpum]